MYASRTPNQFPFLDVLSRGSASCGADTNMYCGMYSFICMDAFGDEYICTHLFIYTLIHCYIYMSPELPNQLPSLGVFRRCGADTNIYCCICSFIYWDAFGDEYICMYLFISTLIHLYIYIYIYIYTSRTPQAVSLPRCFQTLRRRYEYVLLYSSMYTWIHFYICMSRKPPKQFPSLGVFRRCGADTNMYCFVHSCIH